MPDADIADEVRRLRQRPVIVASHPRSGTHLVIDLLRRQFRECRSWKWPGERLNRLYVSLEAMIEPDEPGPISERTALAILRRVTRPIVKTHLALPELRSGPATRRGELGRHWLDWLRECGRIVYVYRDGRDVMCSYHFFAARRPEGRLPLAAFLRQEPEDDGVSRVAAWAASVRWWLARPDVIAVRYEDVLHDTRAVLARLGAGLGMEPLNREPLLPGRFRSVRQSRLNRLFAIRPQSTAIVSRFRNRRLEQWPDAFSAGDRAYFAREAGDLLIDLGYESSAAWVDRCPIDP